MVLYLTPDTAYQKVMETLYLKTVSFQTIHTSPQKIPLVCRRGREERRSMGYYQGGLKFSLMGRHQIWTSATPGQVPRISVLNNRTILNNILQSHVLAARRRKEEKFFI